MPSSLAMPKSLESFPVPCLPIGAMVAGYPHVAWCTRDGNASVQAAPQPLDFLFDGPHQPGHPLDAEHQLDVRLAVQVRQTRGSAPAEESSIGGQRAVRVPAVVEPDLDGPQLRDPVLEDRKSTRLNSS